MRRRLSKALWLFAAGALAAGGCGKNDDTAKATGAGGEVATQVVMEEREHAEAPPSPDPMATTPAVESKDARLDQATSSGVLGATRTGKVGAVGYGTGAPGRVNGQYAMKRKTASAPRPRDVDVASNTETYADYGVNPMTDTAEDRLSTFAVDVDTASYAIARRKIVDGQRPPASAVRVEEWVNYFNYEYAGPSDDRPFAVHMDAAPSPFSPNRHIVRVGVQAKKLSVHERKPVHLVFLVDVSGSMSSPDKLGLAKRALRILVDNLRDGDTVALVTYASGSRIVLEPTGIENKHVIHAAIEDLQAGGSTAMGQGIELAYHLAGQNLSKDSVSRVIILSDGDANVGPSDHAGLLKLIAGHAKEGVTVSTIGFGMGNYKDELMEQLANKGNGNYYYIDGLSQAKRVFAEQLGGTLEVVAKDVKIQVEWNPKAVKRYRLIGYENRDIADDDFRDDKVDAGEIGAGHTVTALYEIELAEGDESSSLATVRIRAKQPRGTKAAESAYLLDRGDVAGSFDGASNDFRFAVAVMAGAEILRGSPHAAEWDLAKVIAIASRAGAEGNSERTEFVELMRTAETKQIARN